MFGSGTVQLDIKEWEIEFGVTGHAYSIGASYFAGIDSTGFNSERGLSVPFDVELLLRVKWPEEWNNYIEDLLWAN